MKRLFAFLVAMSLLMAVPLYAAGPVSSLSSGLKTADAAITTVSGYLTGVLIVTDGTNDATVIVYDNESSAAGTVLFKAKVLGASNFGGGTWEVPIQYSDGLYVDVTGTNAAYIVYFREGY